MKLREPVATLYLDTDVGGIFTSGRIITGHYHRKNRLEVRAQVRRQERALVLYGISRKEVEEASKLVKFPIKNIKYYDEPQKTLETTVTAPSVMLQISLSAEERNLTVELSRRANIDGLLLSLPFQEIEAEGTRYTVTFSSKRDVERARDTLVSLLRESPPAYPLEIVSHMIITRPLRDALLDVLREPKSMSAMVTELHNLGYEMESSLARKQLLLLRGEGVVEKLGDRRGTKYISSGRGGR